MFTAVVPGGDGAAKWARTAKTRARRDDLSLRMADDGSGRKGSRASTNATPSSSWTVATAQPTFAPAPSVPRVDSWRRAQHRLPPSAYAGQAKTARADDLSPARLRDPVSSVAPPLPLPKRAAAPTTPFGGSGFHDTGVTLPTPGVVGDAPAAAAPPPRSAARRQQRAVKKPKASASASVMKLWEPVEEASQNWSVHSRQPKQVVMAAQRKREFAAFFAASADTDPPAPASPQLLLTHSGSAGRLAITSNTPVPSAIDDACSDAAAPGEHTSYTHPHPPQVLPGKPVERAPLEWHGDWPWQLTPTPPLLQKPPPALALASAPRPVRAVPGVPRVDGAAAGGSRAVTPLVTAANVTAHCGYLSNTTAGWNLAMAARLGDLVDNDVGEWTSSPIEGLPAGDAGRTPPAQQQVDMSAIGFGLGDLALLPRDGFDADGAAPAGGTRSRRVDMNALLEAVKAKGGGETGGAKAPDVGGWVEKAFLDAIPTSRQRVVIRQVVEDRVAVIRQNPRRFRELRLQCEALREEQRAGANFLENNRTALERHLPAERRKRVLLKAAAQKARAARNIRRALIHQESPVAEFADAHKNPSGRSLAQQRAKREKVWAQFVVLINSCIQFRIRSIVHRKEVDLQRRLLREQQREAVMVISTLFLPQVRLYLNKKRREAADVVLSFLRNRLQSRGTQRIINTLKQSITAVQRLYRTWLQRRQGRRILWTKQWLMQENVLREVERERVRQRSQKEGAVPNALAARLQTTARSILRVHEANEEERESELSVLGAEADTKYSAALHLYRHKYHMYQEEMRHYEMSAGALPPTMRHMVHAPDKPPKPRRPLLLNAKAVEEAVRKVHAQMQAEDEARARAKMQAEEEDGAAQRAGEGVQMPSGRTLASKARPARVASIVLQAVPVAPAR